MTTTTTTTTTTLIPPPLPHGEHKSRLRRVDVKLAMVCYGGVSLAVYMFGTVCEFRTLLTAARAFDKTCAGDSSSARALVGTAKVYHDLLLQIRDQYAIEIHLVLDYVSGTSAGGINAVALATSSVYASSLQPLRSTWLEKADAEVLRYTSHPNLWALKSPSLASLGAVIGTNLHYLSTFLWPSNYKKIFSSSSGVMQIPDWFLEYAVTAVAGKFPIFDGVKFHLILLDRVEKLINPNGTLPALHDGDRLTLFVTLTDLNPFQRNIATGLRHMKESTHSMVMRFDKHGVVNDFQVPLQLSFAARVTSAFPFAFQGMQMADVFNDKEAYPFIADHFRDVELDIAHQATEKARRPPPSASYLQQIASLLPSFSSTPPPPRPYEYLPLQNHEFADGGLMMNKPFLPIIRALKAKRKVFGNNTQRRVVYLEPSPEACPSKEIRRGRDEEEYEDRGFGDDVDIFSAEGTETYGSYAASLKKRNEDLEKANPSPQVHVLGIYDHISHASEVMSAITSQPISDQIREIEAYNSQIRDMHKFMLREYVHMQISSLSFLPEGWDRRDSLSLDDFVQGVPTDLEKQYNEARAIDAHQSLAEALSGRQWFYFTEMSFQRDTFIELIKKVGNKEIENRRNPFFFRDCLCVLVAVMENHLLNPLTFPVDNQQGEVNIQLARQVSDKTQQVMREMDEIISGRSLQTKEDQKVIDTFNSWFRRNFQVQRDQQNGATTRTVAISDERIRHLLYSSDVEHHHLTAARPEDQNIIDNLNDLATFAFTKFQQWMEETKSRVIDKLIPEILSLVNNAPDLKRLILQTLLGFTYFDALTFQMMTSTPLGDNAVTKVTRVSPDNCKILFSKSREHIKSRGYTSIANVFVRSNDAAHFGGFFSGEYRESDMIWGRLDGAEAVCNLLLESAQEEILKGITDHYIVKEDLLRHAKRTPEVIGNNLRQIANSMIPPYQPRIKRANHSEVYYKAFAEVLKDEIHMNNEGKWKSETNKAFFNKLLHEHAHIKEFAITPVDV